MSGKKLNLHSVPLLLFVLAVTFTILMWMAVPRKSTLYDSMLSPALQVTDSGGIRANVAPSQPSTPENPGVVNEISIDTQGILSAKVAGSSMVLQLAIDQAFADTTQDK